MKTPIATEEKSPSWTSGKAPVAVVMISLNEAHNMGAVLDNISGWAQEVFLVDSFSTDDTVDIALSKGVHVVQRSFQGFGDQWNYAVNELPINAPWTMKLDPDERLTPELKSSIEKAIADDASDAVLVQRSLWFMGARMAVRQNILRLWRTGTCRFSDVEVNEHPIVSGREFLVDGDLEHRDSPNLHHWFEKQNRYTTVEAAMAVRGDKLSIQPNLFGTALARRMWLKNIYKHIPFRHLLMFLYCYLWLGAWRAGRVGFIWARLRSAVFIMIDHKSEEMRILGDVYSPPPAIRGDPHPGAVQAEGNVNSDMNGI